MGQRKQILLNKQHYHRSFDNMMYFLVIFNCVCKNNSHFLVYQNLENVFLLNNARPETAVFENNIYL